LSKKQAFERNVAKPQAAAEPEEDEDYEPEYQPVDLSAAPAAAQPETAGLIVPEPQPDLALGPFVLPQPPPLTPEEASQLGRGTVQRIFGMITTLEQPSKATKGSQNVGFGRLAASSLDRDSWLTLLTRLATRASAGLDALEAEGLEKLENGAALSAAQRQDLADGIRETLYRYVLEDFRVRMNAAISWLNEEWYNDRIQVKHALAEHNGDADSVAVPRHYERWVMRVLEGILPYLDTRDKVLIRFLSEVPELNGALIEKVKTLANDPERVNLCVQSLQWALLATSSTAFYTDKFYAVISSLSVLLLENCVSMRWKIFIEMVSPAVSL
jgi:symplekin